MFYFGDGGGWNCRMLEALIEAAPSLRHLRNVVWVDDMPSDKQEQLATRLSPCALTVQNTLVPATRSMVDSGQHTEEQDQGSSCSPPRCSSHAVHKVVETPSLQSRPTVSDAALEAIAAVISPQYIGADGEEPPAHVAPDEAEVLSAQLWASGVQKLVNRDASEVDTHEPHGQSHEDRLVLLTFSRHPSQMHDALLQSELAVDLVTQGVNVQPQWADGGLLLASGVDESTVAEARQKWHVAVRETDEGRVFDALEQLPYRIRPRLKQGGRFTVPEDSTLFGDASDDSENEVIHDDSNDLVEITVERTFFHIPPVPMGSLSPRTIRTA